MDTNRADLSCRGRERASPFVKKERGGDQRRLRLRGRTRTAAAAKTTDTNTNTKQACWGCEEEEEGRRTNANASAWRRRQAVGLVATAVATLGASACGDISRATASTSQAERLAQDYDKYSQNYDKLETGELAKAAQLSDLRELAVSRASGKTLEIGVGTGINLDLYNFDNVTRFTGLDISQGMLDKSRARVGEMQVGGDRIELVQGDAAALPFESDAFDTVVVTYALCVIPNAKSSLEEIARVLKPEGRAYLVEHVSSDLKPLAQYQKFLSPFIVEFGKGCDWSKDIPGLVQASGLQLVTIDRRVGGTVAFMEVKRKSA